MSVRRTSLPGTGIYQQEIVEAELKADDPRSWSEFKKILEELRSKEETPLQQLERLEIEADGFLKQYVWTDMGGPTEAIRQQAASAGLDYVVQNHIMQVRRELAVQFEKQISQEKKRELSRKLLRLEKASDACQIARDVSLIRGLMRYGSVEQVVSHAIALGRAVERFHVRDSEDKARTGGKALQGASEGGLLRKKSTEDYQKLVKDFRRSGMSQRDFASTYHISRSQLQRALKITKKLDSSPAK
jgi:hypothetical protein